MKKDQHLREMEIDLIEIEREEEIHNVSPIDYK